MELLLPSGEILTLKPGHELFHATCGGLGLTGFILNATIKLRQVRSGNIRQLLFVTRNLAETLEIFEKYRNVSFSAGWLDGTAHGKTLQRLLFPQSLHETGQIRGVLPGVLLSARFP